MGISFRGGRRRNQRRGPQKRKKLHRTNEEIRAPQVRVVDEEGEMLGVMDTAEAIAKAKNEAVDLVEISPKADPPVCKIIDYGKMLYALQKKEKQAKKASKTHEMKGIRITFRIGPADLDRQRMHAEEFLLEGHPVKVQMMMRGREKAHKNLAIEKMNDFLKNFEEIASVDEPPRFGGYQVTAILKPSKKN